MTTTYDERAAASAAFLDETMIAWDAQIDVARLDMARGADCIGGQLCGNYSIFAALMQPWGSLEQSGFNPDASVPGERAELTAAWRRLIAARRFDRGAINPTLLAEVVVA